MQSGEKSASPLYVRSPTLEMAPYVLKSQCFPLRPLKHTILECYYGDLLKGTKNILAAPNPALKSRKGHITKL